MLLSFVFVVAVLVLVLVVGAMRIAASAVLSVTT